VFSGSALLTLFFLLQLFTPTRRAGNILTSVVLFPLMMIGGSFFPFEAMPAWMVDVGSRTPNGLGVLRLKDILRGEVQSGSLLLAVAVIGGFALLALLVSDHLLRRRFAVS
jgi:ABC-type multidrug transport system permease subunit